MSPPASPTASTGPSRSPITATSATGSRSDLWSEILSSADRQKTYGRKNVLLLSERHHGRRYLLDQILSNNPSSTRKRPTNKKVSSIAGPSGPGSGSGSASAQKARSLAMGYEVLQVREEGDEESVPPVSIFYPPSSHSTMTGLIGPSLPPNSILDTAVMILLDWTKPWSMVRELLTWLRWVAEWADSTASPAEAEELHDRLQSHLQHYAEPAAANPSVSSPGAAPAAGSSSIAYGNIGPLLPLGPGTLTLNHGIPILVVCTKADLMDSVGEEVGMKGPAWEERTDWIQQVLRTVCLAYGASLFYTAPTAPDTYSLLRTYLLHRLHTVPPPLHSEGSSPSSTTRFPFPHRANVLDRDAVMVPAGWDSWGKINVLREGFDPSRISKAWSVSLAGPDGDGESIEEILDSTIPNHEKTAKPTNSQAIATTVEPEQTFLARHLEALLKDPNRDPRQSFRHAAATASQTAAPSSEADARKDESRYAGYGGVVGPMGSGGLSLPGVEKAMAEMEGAEDLKEKFARLGRREPSRTGAPVSPTVPTTGGSAVPNEALHNFFQGLLATKAKTGSTSSKPAPAPDVKET